MVGEAVGERSWVSLVALIAAVIAVFAPVGGWIAAIVGMPTSAQTFYVFVGCGLFGFLGWVVALVAGGFATVDGERRGLVALAIAGFALVSWCAEWALYLQFGDLNPMNL